MSMKFKKTLALVLSIVTVFSAAFTSMADVEVVEEVDQIMVPEEPVEEVSDIFNTATPEEVTVLEDVAEVTEVVEDTTNSNIGEAIAETGSEPILGGNSSVWAHLQDAVEKETTASGVIGYLSWGWDTEDPSFMKVTLENDILYDSDGGAITVPADRKVILDLNGHVLNRGLIAQDGTATSNDHGSVIEVYGKLTIKDSNPSTEHTFKKQESGLWVLNGSEGETKTVTGGVITGGTGTKNTYYYGGGIYVAGTGELIVEAGTVCGNQTKRGGGIELLSNGKFIMRGGKICGNVSDDDKNGNGGGVNNYGTFTMEGGSIEFNTSYKTGGGIYNHNELVITGGVISNNTAKSSGGGIRGDSKNNSISCISDTNSNISITNNIAGGKGGGIDASTSIELGGNVDISENTNEALKQPDDLYLNAAGNRDVFTLAYIKVVEPIAGLHIGVARLMAYDVDSYVVGPITDANTNPTVAEKALPHFYATVDTQYVKYNSEGYLELAEKMAITISDSIVNGTVTASPRGGLKDETITLTVTPDTGYTLKADTLKATYNDGTSKTITPVKDATDGTKYTFTMPGYPVTVTAEFKKIITIADILALSEEKFPDSEPDAWVNENGAKMCIKNNGTDYLYPGMPLQIDLGTPVEESGSNYVYVMKNSSGKVIVKITFNMSGDTLQSITVSDSANSTANGTYTPSKQITIGDIIAKSKDFPRSKSGAWENENGKRAYALSDSIQIGNFRFLFSTALTESGEDYVYVWDGDMSNFLFKMKEGSLQSIIVSGSTRSAASNGEYKLRKTDPTPVEKESEEREPLFTGTWNNPVKNGAWSQDARGIWHYASSETFKNTWAYIYNPYAHDGQNTSDWFWFDRQGNMLTGWQQIGGKWYYLHPNKDGVLGSCLIGPAVTPDGHTVDATGAWDGNGAEPVSEAAKAGTNPGAASAPYTGTWNAPVQNGAWSLDANGIWHYTTTQQFKNTWAYIYNPYAHDGQHTSDWFWFDEKGNMLTGWQRINGKWYYLHPNKDGVLGSCLIGPTTTPDGYKVDETGARID